MSKMNFDFSKIDVEDFASQIEDCTEKDKQEIDRIAIVLERLIKSSYLDGDGYYRNDRGETYNYISFCIHDKFTVNFHKDKEVYERKYLTEYATKMYYYGNEETLKRFVNYYLTFVVPQVKNGIYAESVEEFNVKFN